MDANTKQINDRLRDAAPALIDALMGYVEEDMEVSKRMAEMGESFGLTLDSSKSIHFDAAIAAIRLATNNPST